MSDLLKEANRDAQNRWNPKPRKSMEDAMTGPPVGDEGNSQIGSDGEMPVSQRQLQDHAKLEESERKGGFKLVTQQYEGLRDDIAEVKEMVGKLGESLEKHALDCPAVAQVAENEKAIKGLTWRFWLLVGTLSAGGGGVIGVVKLLSP